MAANVPEGFEATNSEFMAHIPITKKQTFYPESIKKITINLQPHLSPLYNRLRVMLNKPKIRKFYSEDYDLVHSGQSILETNLPYIMDFEHAAVFSGYNQYAFEKQGFKKALARLLLDKKLKKLTPWSNAAKESLLNFIKDEKLAEKTEVVYPVMSTPKELNREKHDSVNFIFVGGIFFEKGGYDTLLAFQQISERYDCTLTMISHVPEEIKRKFSQNKKIIILGSQPYENVKKQYLKSDVMIFPTHYDTYGFVIPEAYSFGLPVIGVDSFSSPELIEHEETGLIVESFYSCFRDDRAYRYNTFYELGKNRLEKCKQPTEKYIKRLSDAMARIIEDGNLRAKLSENARKEALEGKFSDKVWKKKMKKIYNEAIE